MSGSNSLATTPATFVIVPGEAGTTTIGTVVEELSEPRVQVTVVPQLSAEQRESLAGGGSVEGTNVTPDGSMSVTVTPVAVVPPGTDTRRLYVSGAPAVGLAGETVVETDRFAVDAIARLGHATESAIAASRLPKHVFTTLIPFFYSVLAGRPPTNGPIRGPGS